MSSKHMTKEELRHDSFVDSIGSISNYLQTNFMTVLVALAGVVLVVVLGVFFRQSQIRTDDQAEQAFFRVTSRYSQGVFSEALTEADVVMDRFDGRKEAVWTLYFAGASHLALSENDRAIERFQEYLDKDSGGQYEIPAKLGMALAMESRGDKEPCLAVYEEVRSATDTKSPLHIQAVLGQTRVLGELGRYDDAIAILEPLIGGAEPAVVQELQARVDTFKALRG